MHQEEAKFKESENLKCKDSRSSEEALADLVWRDPDASLI
jgi:hypothetical protein